MSYIKKTLLKQEELLYRIRPHWIMFGQAILWMIAALAFIIGGQCVSFLDDHFGNSPKIYWIFSAISAAIGTFCFFENLLKYFGAEYGVTTQRVLMKRGIIRRTTNEIFISKVESIKVKQSILGRLLNYGSLEISGIGGQHEPFVKVPAPLKFRENVQNQLDQRE